MDSTFVLAELQTDRLAYQFKEVPIEPVRRFADINDQLHVVVAAMTFTNRADAALALAELDALWTSRGNNILYAEAYLYDNSHHWLNPDPDILLFTETHGNKRNLDAYEIFRN